MNGVANDQGCLSERRKPFKTKHGRGVPAYTGGEVCSGCEEWWCNSAWGQYLIWPLRRTVDIRKIAFFACKLDVCSFTVLFALLHIPHSSCSSLSHLDLVRHVSASFQMVCKQKIPGWWERTLPREEREAMELWTEKSSIRGVPPCRLDEW